MLDTYSDDDHAVISSRAPYPEIEIFVARGHAKIKTIMDDNHAVLAGYVTPSCSSDRAAINALADKLSQHAGLEELADALREPTVGGVVFS